MPRAVIRVLVFLVIGLTATLTPPQPLAVSCQPSTVDCQPSTVNCRLSPGQPSTAANRLSASASPYLRRAAQQKIAWYPWSAEAFVRARQEDKPILLDIGANWCHWCHVMDETTYARLEIADYLNERFVCVKVDRDELPDVDRRYQQASAVLGAGGWPLTVFLTPEGKLFAAGTYFPPDDREGRPGFATVLHQVAEAWRDQKDRIKEAANQIQQAVDRESAHLPRASLTAEVVDRIWSRVLTSWDRTNGGFGKSEGTAESGSPVGAKFPLGSAVELALVRYFERGDRDAINVAATTLQAMLLGGIWDQLGGGFHRYSTDGAWRVPHFEKLLPVQAEMLRAYAVAYQVTANESFRVAMEQLMEYVNGSLRDPEGGFYASQDADAGDSDDGRYYTWSQEEVSKHLTAEETTAALAYLGLDDRRNRVPGEERFVPQRALTMSELAARVNRPASELPAIVDGVLQKLRAVRAQRPAPQIDKTVYLNWNGMIITALFQAYRATGKREWRDLAVQACDRILAQAYRQGKGLPHRLAIAEVAPETLLLDDQVQMARAFLEAYELRSQAQYLDAARDLLELARTRFWDSQAGGFFDRVHQETDFAFLRVRHKPIEDSPTPGANAVAALALQRLSVATGDAKYKTWAHETLRAMAGRAEEFGRFGSTFAMAAQEYFRPGPVVTVIGKRADLRTQLFWTSALRQFRPGAFVLLRDPSKPKLPHPASRDGKAVGYVCLGKLCSPPIRGTVELAEAVKNWGRATRSKTQRQRP